MLRMLAIAGLVACVPAAGSVAAVRTGHAEVDLLSSAITVAPGDTFTVAIQIQHDPHWHSYWINPGDAGMATRVTWELPPGYSASELRWPAPSRFETEGLMSFGYSGEAVLLADITASSAPPSGPKVAIRAKVSMLLCKDICVPESATVERVLSVGEKTAANTELAAWFQEKEGLIPADPTDLPDWSVRARLLSGEAVVLSVTPPIEAAFFYPEQKNLFAYDKPQSGRSPGELKIPLADTADAIPERLTGVLVSEGDMRAVRVDATLEK